MSSYITQLHKVFLAGILSIVLTLSIAGAPLTVHATEAEGGTAETTTEPRHADNTTGSYSDGYITLPFSQVWSGSAPDTSVEYTLTPVKITDDPYTYDTPANAESGRIRYAFGTSAEDKVSGSIKTTVTGNATGQITFKWEMAGVYVFELRETTAARSNYSYDSRTYRIRVYVRDTVSSAFVTAQVVGNENNADQGKVGKIEFDPGYSEPSQPGGGGDDDGGSNSTPRTTPTRRNETLDENGSTGDTIGELSEYGNDKDDDTIGELIEYGGNGNHGNAYTGDESNMMWYLLIAILAAASLAAWTTYRIRTHQHEQ